MRTRQDDVSRLIAILNAIPEDKMTTYLQELTLTEGNMGKESSDKKFSEDLSMLLGGNFAWDCMSPQDGEVSQVHHWLGDGNKPSKGEKLMFKESRDVEVKGRYRDDLFAFHRLGLVLGRASEEEEANSINKKLRKIHRSYEALPRDEMWSIDWNDKELKVLFDGVLELENELEAGGNVQSTDHRRVDFWVCSLLRGLYIANEVNREGDETEAQKSLYKYTEEDLLQIGVPPHIAEWLHKTGEEMKEKFRAAHLANIKVGNESTSKSSQEILRRHESEFIRAERELEELTGRHATAHHDFMATHRSATLSDERAAEVRERAAAKEEETNKERWEPVLIEIKKLLTAVQFLIELNPDIRENFIGDHNEDPRINDDDVTEPEPVTVDAMESILKTLQNKINGDILSHAIFGVNVINAKREILEMFNEREGSSVSRAEIKQYAKEIQASLYAWSVNYTHIGGKKEEIKSVGINDNEEQESNLCDEELAEIMGLVITVETYEKWCSPSRFFQPYGINRWKALIQSLYQSEEQNQEVILKEAMRNAINSVGGDQNEGKRRACSILLNALQKRGREIINEMDITDRPVNND